MGRRRTGPRAIPQWLGDALRRSAIAGAGLGLAGAGLTAAAWQRIFRRPLPQVEGTIRLAGPSAPIEIRRDRWGVPHIEAADRHDLWFGQGFCHGQDRLWQLELYRRLATGRLAEIAGAEALPTDRLMRTLGLGRVAAREEAELEAGLRAELDAFCAGVNAASAAAPARPAELQILRLTFEPWRPADMIAALKLLAFGLSTNWERELLRAEMIRELGPERAARLDHRYPHGNPVVLDPGGAYGGEGLALAEQIDRVRETLGLTVEATGSNNWAVAPARSATGGALLAGDPHLPPSMPGITYEVGLRHGERLGQGASLPGIPGLLLGQNNDVAWAFTNVLADVQDLFVERIRGDAYEFEGDHRPLEVSEELIEVRGAEPERLRVRATHHGPIVNGVLGADDSAPLALAFTALRLPAIGRAQVSVLDPTSGPELVEMLSDFCAPVSNLVWADRHGSIGYKMVGRIPVRRSAVADLPKPGWTGEHDWDGYVPYQELPAVTDPECGYVITANNQIVGDDYPHHVSSDYLDGHRARRIEELLLSTPEHDLDGFQAMQLDLRSIPGAETIHRLARIEDRARDQREVRAIERLRSWDGRMSADSVAATIYQAFTLRLARETARAAIGDRDLAARWLDRSVSGFTNHITSPWRWQSHLLRLWEESDPELIGRDWTEHALDALRGALDDLADRFGPDPERWRWGRVHALRFPHALGEANPVLGRIFNRTVELGGAQETINQVGFDPDDPFCGVWAPCWRMVADAADPERSRWQQFTGQSGHPASPHYDDLQERWRDGEMQPAAGEGPWTTLRLAPDGADSH